MSDVSAYDLYEARLVPLDGDGPVRRLARSVWAAAAAWPPGLLPLPTVAHLVVTERATGRTVHRRPVDSGEAGGILAYVHERMARESPERFRESLDDLYRSPAARPEGA
ncbi:hypothetical protein [Georgenia thermotolerans]|uniref:Uncharacterized protein n=1 Tax=Georgenia thermotolerans TaxID=527326 RepID=A0A7J5UP75_9MICO|nr:hypothetical protein [Georgenia thermotolerans]KAE8764041.1 hypothetical protein GB883_10995 [Georgenia thermotolerans]